MRVVGSGDAEEGRLQGDLPPALEPVPGEVRLLLLRGRRGVTLGSALTRRPEVVERIRRVPDLGEVRLSRVGGTVGPEGENWLGLVGAAGLADPVPRPLDTLTQSIRIFLERRLRPFGVQLDAGKVEGAWCPGFSDLSVEGRKLVGLGYRLTPKLALIRGVVAVRAPGSEELEALHRCHLAFGPGIAASVMTALSHLDGLGSLDQAGAIQLLGGGQDAPAKMAP